ncbi:hypothetical protein [Vibrio phage vB_pir03]|nr:hypothetical protein [Vibrio phage vB_pir03]
MLMGTGFPVLVILLSFYFSRRIMMQLKALDEYVYEDTHGWNFLPHLRDNPPKDMKGTKSYFSAMMTMAPYYTKDTMVFDISIQELIDMKEITLYHILVLTHCIRRRLGIIPVEGETYPDAVGIIPDNVATMDYHRVIFNEKENTLPVLEKLELALIAKVAKYLTTETMGRIALAWSNRPEQLKKWAEEEQYSVSYPEYGLRVEGVAIEKAIAKVAQFFKSASSYQSQNQLLAEEIGYMEDLYDYLMTGKQMPRLPAKVKKIGFMNSIFDFAPSRSEDYVRRAFEVAKEISGQLELTEHTVLARLGVNTQNCFSKKQYEYLKSIGPRYASHPPVADAEVTKAITHKEFMKLIPALEAKDPYVVNLHGCYMMRASEKSFLKEGILMLDNWLTSDAIAKLIHDEFKAKGIAIVFKGDDLCTARLEEGVVKAQALGASKIVLEGYHVSKCMGNIRANFDFQRVTLSYAPVKVHRPHILSNRPVYQDLF